MWREIWWLAVHALKNTFRKRSSLLIYLGLPILGVVATIMLYGNSGQQVLRVGIANEDGSSLIASDTAAYVSSLQNVKTTLLTREELQKKLASSDLDTGLILEKGYSDSVAAGKPEDIIIQSVKGQTVTAYAKGMLNAYLGNTAAISRAAGGDRAAFDKLYAGYRSGGFKLETEPVKDTSLTRAMSNQSIGFLIMFMMTAAVNLSEIILKSREDRTYFRILSSPISSRTYVLANILVNLTVMVVQVAVALIFLRYVFNIDPGLPVAQLGGMLILFALVSVSLSLVIVAFSRNSAVSSSMSNFIITPSCLLAGCFFPSSIMPETIRRIGDFMPQRWVLQSIEDLQAGDTSRIALNMAVLAAFALVFFLIAAYKFGRSNDTRSFV
jgi:ABC-2 type transport system permease protein